jgi:hypothetical protein
MPESCCPVSLVCASHHVPLTLSNLALLGATALLLETVP